MTEPIADGDGAVPVVVADELTADERLFLEAQDVDPADERLAVVRSADGTLGVDVQTRRGPVRIRWAGTATVTMSRVPLTGEPLEPWLITAAPGRLAGTRYDTAGKSIRAALRGFPWPKGWAGAPDEETFPTDLPDRPVSLPGIFIEDMPEIKFTPYRRSTVSGDDPEIDSIRYGLTVQETWPFPVAADEAPGEGFGRDGDAGR